MAAGDIEVPGHRLAGFIERTRALWLAAGNIESSFLADELERVRIDRPVFIAGLARAGSTIELEVLAALPGVASHRYRDFPPIYTPYFWNRLVDRLPKPAATPAERTHQDGILVTPESPEAMEEPLWMAFFPDAHDPSVSNVLDGSGRNAAFDRFYVDHLRKLLLVRGGTRYVSKGNYNVSRLGYLRALFPDARFIVPIRSPAAHVASLIKQHRLFVDASARNPKVRDHLRRVGHFEFGPDRRPISFGDREQTAAIQALWDSGAEARGMARYWAAVYAHVGDLLADQKLEAATMVLRYEDLCREPETMIRRMIAHAQLPEDEAVIARFAHSITFPTYYRPDLSDDDMAGIEQEAGSVARRFGYADALTAT